jgi:hypothetical protein
MRKKESKKGRKNKQTNRQTDKQANKQTNKQKYRTPNLFSYFLSGMSSAGFSFGKSLS